ncbi:MAG: ABC transporter ATP-binding protein [Bacilli bacterium]|jgi:ABC-2 type transport system ATP-binding protein|nr:ABC transporter ATP-binding protein [Bacilli bacterium]
MIEIRNLTKSFNPDSFVLENLNCTIKDNAIYGLVGANGAGKSTLLRLINSIYKPNSGSISIDGINTYDNEELKQDMVFVPDDLFFYSGYTLMDMASYYEALYNKFDMNYVIEKANKLKLNLNTKISSYSKGMKRQCALICALATNAKYMFFDETFDGLDPVVRKYFKTLLADQMSKNNTTIIMTSHNLRELEDICDNLGLLYKGNILFESDIDTLKTHMFKVQISLKQDFNKKTFKGLKILSYKKIGSVATLIIDEKDSDSRKILENLNPIILDYLPLTLEEVFIYQMEALGYEFNEIV